MAKKILLHVLSVAFFVVFAVGIVMLTDLLFNNSTTFYDRFSDIKNIFGGLKG